jgi:hypothetical protein
VLRLSGARGDSGAVSGEVLPPRGQILCLFADKSGAALAASCIAEPVFRERDRLPPALGGADGRRPPSHVWSLSETTKSGPARTPWRAGLDCLPSDSAPSVRGGRAFRKAVTAHAPGLRDDRRAAEPRAAGRCGRPRIVRDAAARMSVGIPVGRGLGTVTLRTARDPLPAAEEVGGLEGALSDTRPPPYSPTISRR